MAVPLHAVLWGPWRKQRHPQKFPRLLVKGHQDLGRDWTREKQKAFPGEGIRGPSRSPLRGEVGGQMNLNTTPRKPYIALQRDKHIHQHRMEPGQSRVRWGPPPHHGPRASYSLLHHGRGHAESRTGTVIKSQIGIPSQHPKLPSTAT